MNLKTLAIILCLNQNVDFPSSILTGHANPRKEQFLKTLKQNNPSDIVYVFDEIETDDWSADIYKVFNTVYTINLAKKNTSHIFRKYSIFKDNDTVLNNENLYIISMQSIGFFEEFLTNLRQLVFWKARHKLVFIINNDTETSENLRKYFQCCFKSWTINIAIVFIDNLDVSYTYNPFQYNYFIARNTSDIFFDKTLNLYGFRLNLSIFPESLNAREVHGAYEGIDAWMSTTIMETINATYNYVVPPEGAVFGGYNETSADGALADVISGKVQAAFNSRFFRESLYKVVELTYPHRRNDLVVLVPLEKPAKLKNIFAMTSVLTWALLLGLSILFLLYIYKFTNHLDFGAALAVIVLIITGRPVHDLTFTKFRIFFMSSMLLVFYLTADFNSRLTSVLTISRVPPLPRTLDELWAATRYKIKSRPSFAGYLSLYVNPKLGHKLLKNAEGLERDAQISEIMKCNKEIILCKRDIAKTAIKKTLIVNRTLCYRVMREIFMPSIQTYIVPYGSPFLERFTGIVLRLHDSGIFGYWSKRPAVPSSHRDNKKHDKLSLETLLVAFAVLGSGLLTSTIVFLYEYRSKKIRTKPIRKRT